MKENPGIENSHSEFTVSPSLGQDRMNHREHRGHREEGLEFPYSSLCSKRSTSGRPAKMSHRPPRPHGRGYNRSNVAALVRAWIQCRSDRCREGQQPDASPDTTALRPRLLSRVAALVRAWRRLGCRRELAPQSLSPLWLKILFPSINSESSRSRVLEFARLPQPADFLGEMP